MSEHIPSDWARREIPGKGFNAPVLTPAMIVRQRTIQHQFLNGFARCTAGYTAPNQQVFLMLYIGVEPLVCQSEHTLESVLEHLGYRLVPIDDGSPTTQRTG